MPQAIKCDVRDKPGNNETVKQSINWDRLKYYPDSDRKRSTFCKEYTANQSKKH